jgi:hypothetical protein
LTTFAVAALLTVDAVEFELVLVLETELALPLASEREADAVLEPSEPELEEPPPPPHAASDKTNAKLRNSFFITDSLTEGR